MKCTNCGRTLATVTTRVVVQSHGSSWTALYGPKCARALGLGRKPKPRAARAIKQPAQVDERQLSLELA